MLTYVGRGSLTGMRRPLVRRKRPLVGIHRSADASRFTISERMERGASDPMLNVKNLRKTFGSLVAVDNVTFAVGGGELIGLLGPNGAGKTTTVSMIAGLLSADSGEVLVGGNRLVRDTDPVKRRIGLVPQDLALYEELSARDNLRFFGALSSPSGAALARAILSAAELVELADRLKDKVKTFSGGMKRRLNLAAGLLHDPDILLLDQTHGGGAPHS